MKGFTGAWHCFIWGCWEATEGYREGEYWGQIWAAGTITVVTELRWVGGGGGALGKVGGLLMGAPPHYHPPSEIAGTEAGGRRGQEWLTSGGRPANLPCPTLPPQESLHCSPPHLHQLTAAHPGTGGVADAWGGHEAGSVP